MMAIIKPIVASPFIRHESIQVIVYLPNLIEISLAVIE